MQLLKFMTFFQKIAYVDFCLFWDNSLQETPLKIINAIFKNSIVLTYMLLPNHDKFAYSHAYFSWLLYLIYSFKNNKCNLQKFDPFWYMSLPIMLLPNHGKFAYPHSYFFYLFRIETITLKQMKVTPWFISLKLNTKTV